MLVFLALLTLGYVGVVLFLRRAKRTMTGPTLAAVADLPADDRPPPAAVGWPPAGSGFESYVDDGFAALDAYLSEGFAA